MTRHRTFRVIVTKSEIYVIDVVARDEAQAIARAKGLWYRGERSRFEPLLHDPQLSFEIDEQACLHQGDAQNDDRSEWAETALRAFSAKTGSSLGDEGVGDLIADLGHYADTNKLDFVDVVRTALANWAVERQRGPSDDRIPPVTIRIGEGGEP